MQSSSRLTPIQWTICVIAAIGFTFDTYELLMLPLVIEPALTSFGIPKTIVAANGGVMPNPDFKHWGTLLFFLPALLGGVFGLLGGYLTDRLGRRRMLTFSILLYAFSAFASGFSTTPGMFLSLPRRGLPSCSPSPVEERRFWVTPRLSVRLAVFWSRSSTAG
jgi:MFS family permease